MLVYNEKAVFMLDMIDLVGSRYLHIFESSTSYLFQVVRYSSQQAPANNCHCLSVHIYIISTNTLHSSLMLLLLETPQAVLECRVRIPYQLLCLYWTSLSVNQLAGGLAGWLFNQLFLGSVCSPLVQELLSLFSQTPHFL